MKQRQPLGAFFERAPNVLLEKIAELTSVLTNYRNNGHFKTIFDALYVASNSHNIYVNL